jgi:hypothetical protein
MTNAGNIIIRYTIARADTGKIIVNAAWDSEAAATLFLPTAAQRRHVSTDALRVVSIPVKV